MVSELNIDFLRPNPKTNNWEAEFEKIAKTLCNQYLIKAGEKMFEIIDIEFYFYSMNHHADIFTYDKNDRNLLFGEWFFHYSGIDITIGDKNGNRGGILLRAIKETGTQNYIIGTLRTMNTLLNCAPSVNSDEPFVLKLMKSPNPKDEIPKGKVRIGLDSDKRNKENASFMENLISEKFQDKKYRYVFELDKIQDRILHDNKTLKVSSQLKRHYEI